MNVRVARRGPAGKYEMWRRCRDPERWCEWMALVRGVDADGPVVPGLEGVLLLVGGVRVPFEVIAVNEAGPSWTRELRFGRVRLEVEHHVDEGFGLVEIACSAVVALAYAPFARRSLTRLLRRDQTLPPVE